MAKDIFHDAVKYALEKDGWTITHDPYLLKNKERKVNLAIDLGAERLLAAEKGTDKIAVEIKSFAKASYVHEFHAILGQYLIYEFNLQTIEPERTLYLAIPDFAEQKLEEYTYLVEFIEKFKIKIIVYEPQAQIIESWRK